MRIKAVQNKSHITNARSNACIGVALVLFVSFMNGRWVCSDMIPHQLQVAVLRCLENVVFTCDAGSSSNSLQNNGDTEQRERRSATTAKQRYVPERRLQQNQLEQQEQQQFSGSRQRHSGEIQWRVEGEYNQHCNEAGEPQNTTALHWKHSGTWSSRSSLH
jgi:hypothetical protein